MSIAYYFPLHLKFLISSSTSDQAKKHEQQHNLNHKNTTTTTLNLYPYRLPLNLLLTTVKRSP